MATPGTQLPPEYETGPITDNAIPVTPGGVAKVAALSMNPITAIPAITIASSTPGVGPLAPGGALGNQIYGAPQSVPPPSAAPPVAAPPVEAPQVAGTTVPAPRHGGGGGGAGPKPADTVQQDINAIGKQEEAGLRQTSEAKQAASDSLAKAQQGLADLTEQQSDELKQRQELARTAQAHLDQQDQANLDKAKSYTIPDFWKGAEGARVGSVISAAAGAISAGILGGPNNALMTINKYTDDYFHRQKEKVDNLYKYAEQTGRINDRTRMRYAQELTDLQAQHAAVQQSIIQRIEAVKTKNQGNVDAAALDEMLAKAKGEQLKRVEDWKMNQAHISLMGAQASAARANAFESRAKGQAALAGGQGGDKTAVFDEQNRLIGHVTGGKGGAQAFMTRDADYARAEHTLQSLIADVQQNGGRVFGPDAAKQRRALYDNAVIGVATVSPLGKTNEAQELEKGSIGSSGSYTAMGANLDALQRKLHEVRNQREQYRNQGLINYQGGGGQQAPAGGQPQQYPIGATSTSGGRPIVMTANGWQYR